MSELIMNTSYNQDAIRMTEEIHGEGGDVRKLAEHRLSLREEQARKALVALGWTPPDEKPRPPDAERLAEAVEKAIALSVCCCTDSETCPPCILKQALADHGER